jgi:hypothetical protein
MVIELLNYSTSFLNPALKWIAPAIFLIALVLFFFANKGYGGEFKKGIDFLMISILVGVLAMVFRWLGDKIVPDFKWGESLFFLVFAIVNLLAALKLLKYVKEVKKNVKF